MLPHERSLAARHKDKPFAIVGVNSDPKPRFKSSTKRELMNWQSFWDGGTTNGPISTRWAITAWPTVFVLDHKGVIRYKNVHGEELDAAVESLLAEVK
jgi:hypothetical protein